MAKIILANEGSTPATPASGSVVLYTVGGVMHLLDSSGTPHPVDSSGITAGPTGSGATFTGSTALTDAIAAAMAVAPATVGVLPGQYTEDLTLPAGVSLVATFGTVQLNGSITFTGLTSFQSVSGFICRNLYLTAGAPSSAMVILNHCQIEGDDTDPAVVVSDAGWSVLFASCGVDGVSRRAVLSVAADIQGTSSSFKSTGNVAIETTGSVDLQQCSLNGNLTLGSTAQATLLDTTVHFDSGTAPYAFSLGKTSKLRLVGGFSISGIDSATGTLWTGFGSFWANSGTFLGSYNSGFLPSVNMGSEGCIAYVLDMQTLAVVASGTWEPVGGGGGGGIPDPGGETPGAMLYYRDPGGGGNWDLVQHSRDGAALKFSLYNNNGSPYWDFPQTPKDFTLLYEGAAVAGVDPYNVPANPGGVLPLPVATWSASMVGGGTSLTAPGGSEPTWNNQRSVVFTTGKEVSGTPTVVEAPSGGNARTLCLVFDNALGVTPGTNIVSYGNGWTTLSPAGEGFGIVVLANGNLGFSAGGGPSYEVDFGFAAASSNRRLIMVTYDGAVVYWSINGGSWSVGSAMVLNTGGGGGSVATPLIIGGTGASYAIQNVTLYNQNLHNNQGMVSQFLSYCANALGMFNGSTLTAPGGELTSGTLFYYGGGNSLSALNPGTPTNILTVSMSGYPQWSAAPSPSSTLANGTLASRTAGTVGQQYLVADQGGPSHGDLYVCAQANRWELAAYNRTYYPHSPTRYWTMTYTAAGPTFPNSGSLGGAEDLTVTGGFNTNLVAGFGSIPSKRTAFIGNAHANGGSAPVSTANVSLAIWYKPTAATGAVVPLLACTNSDTGPSTGIGIWQDTAIGSVIARVNGFSSTFAVPSELINQDNLLVLTYDQANVGAELTLYANGLAIGSIDTTSAAINWFGCTWMIGNDGSALPVSGELCQAAVWDGTTLASMEVQQIFERGVGTYTGS